MKKKPYLFVFAFIVTAVLSSFFPFRSFSCTMIMASKNGIVLAGNNEDWKNPITKVWFIPASENEYGRICFGFDRDFGFTQGGMNDQGLFIDANAISPTDYKTSPDKEDFNAPMIDYILATCATVEDAIVFFNKYNTRGLYRARFPISDKTGASMVVEWAEGKVQFVKPDTWFQISTNFVFTNVKNGKYPCNRYNIANTLFQNSSELSVGLIRSILSATHAEGEYPTVYSNIYDLKNGIAYVYNFHNFEEVVTFNLAEELKKGRKSYDIPSLFSITTHAAKRFYNTSQKAASEALLKTIEKRGVKKGIEKYFRMKKQFSKSYVYNFSEEEINKLGYMLLNKDRIDDAIAIFKLNTEEHPESWNVYDSLGEAYLKKGEKDLAILNYKKSIELNQENENGKRWLGKLQK